MSFLKRFGPLLLTIGSAVIAAVSPSVQAGVAAHPVLTIGLSLAASVLHALLPSIFSSPAGASK